MLMLIWFILSLFGVCDFTWLPVFIDCFVGAILLALPNSTDSFGSNLLCTVLVGVAGFAFYKFFFGLVVSSWWLLASPIAMIIMLIFPGGFTIVNILFKNLGLITLPTWGLVVGILLDLLMLAVIVPEIVDGIKSKILLKRMKKELGKRN